MKVCYGFMNILFAVFDNKINNILNICVTFKKGSATLKLLYPTESCKITYFKLTMMHQAFWFGIDLEDLLFHGVSIHSVGGRNYLPYAGIG